MLNGFHQIELDENSRDLTSFNTPMGSFRFTRVPFGLKVAPNSFQRMVSLAFADLIKESGLIYLDDIMAIGRDVENHFQNIEKIFLRCREKNLKLNPSKCIFFFK
jgi:hypothetical protein